MPEPAELARRRDVEAPARRETARAPAAAAHPLADLLNRGSKARLAGPAALLQRRAEAAAADAPHPARRSPTPSTTAWDRPFGPFERRAEERQAAPAEFLARRSEAKCAIPLNRRRRDEGPIQLKKWVWNGPSQEEAARLYSESSLWERQGWEGQGDEEGNPPDFFPIGVERGDIYDDVLEAWTPDRDALRVLRSFASKGVLTPRELGSGGVRSADTNAEEPDTIRVNELGREGSAAARAKQAVSTPGTGALPVVIEQRGDKVKSKAGTGLVYKPDALTAARLQLRVGRSALAIIRSTALSVAQQTSLRNDRFGETKLRGSIPASQFDRLLVPKAFESLVEAEAPDLLGLITFVGSKRAWVPYYAAPGAPRISAELDVPDYEAALAEFLQNNPDDLFVTHATRLGGSKPVSADITPLG